MPRARRWAGPLLVALALTRCPATPRRRPPPEFADWTAPRAASRAAPCAAARSPCRDRTSCRRPDSVVDGSSTVFSRPGVHAGAADERRRLLRWRPGLRRTGSTFGAPGARPGGAHLLARLHARLPRRDADRARQRRRAAVRERQHRARRARREHRRQRHRAAARRLQPIPFTADPVFTSPAEDGIYLQVGSAPTPPPPPPPPPRLRHRRRLRRHDPPPVEPRRSRRARGRQVVAGTVRVRLPDGGFAPLDGTDALPVGTVVDARQGALTSAPRPTRAAGSARHGSRPASSRSARPAPRVRSPPSSPPDPPGLARACASRRTRPAKGVVRRLRLTVIKGVFRTVAAAPS